MSGTTGPESERERDTCIFNCIHYLCVISVSTAWVSPAIECVDNVFISDW